MFFIRDIHAYCHRTKSAAPALPQHFGLLCWNVNKSTDIQHYRDLFEALRNEWNLHLILIQEARMRLPSAPFLLPDFSYCSAPNLKQRTLHYGLLTASSQTALEAMVLPSQAKEGILGPGKGALITHHTLSDRQTLTLVNLHAINFRAARIYAGELESLQEYLQKFSGPMIVAGDFNSWSAKRMHVLQTFRLNLGLESVPFPTEKIKTFRGYPLDHILYRELKCHRSLAPDLPHDSDHNPLLAEFSTPHI